MKAQEEIAGEVRVDEDLWLERAKSSKIPVHVGIIMDGNGRWAAKRGLPRSEGHKAGVETIRRCVPALLKLGVKYCSLFVFSTENWHRPKEEVEFLMDLLVQWASSDKRDLVEHGVRVVPVGRWRDLPSPVVAALSRVARETENGGNLQILACINYGGRQEILDAARRMASTWRDKPDLVEGLDEEGFRAFLYDPGVPDVDLVIRTSGELRLSNFMLWQAAYSELVFTDVLWPDFGPVDLYRAVVEFGQRKRRFGGIAEREG